MPTTSPAVELILARLRESGDFPAMAKTVGTVSALTSSEDTSISALADTVLQDYGLAQKLLRLVNTLAYAQHGQVTTVSRAVLLMGFDRVRSVALGLMLFEQLQARGQDAGAARRAEHVVLQRHPRAARSPTRRGSPTRKRPSSPRSSTTWDARWWRCICRRSRRRSAPRRNSSRTRPC